MFEGKVGVSILLICFVLFHSVGRTFALAVRVYMCLREKLE